MLQTVHDRERLRRLFRPRRVRLLFVGEAPPHSGRFFYSRNSGLYRAMRDSFQCVDATIDDDKFLTVFKAAGCYLIDLCPEPVDHLDAESRKAARQAGEASLSQEIARMWPATLAPVLRPVADNVSRAAFNVDWHGPIIHLPYPGRWHRQRTAFIETLAPTLRKLIEATGRR